MTKTPAIRMLLAGFFLVLGSAAPVYAQAKYSPEQMLDQRLAPKHDDVQITVPGPDEIKACTVSLIQGAGQGSGFVLRDGKGQTLRRFFASTGGKVDVWSYYKDGVEVYREFDSAGKGGPNNFRWLNAGGMKWGVGYVDARGKAVISGWRMISAEEVAHEAFQAIATSNFERLQALLITDKEMQMIKIPAAKASAINATQQSVQKQFADLVQGGTLAKVKFDGVETAIPQCDTAGNAETIRFPSRAVRYEYTNAKNDKQHGWIHTGEIIQVGMAWRLVGAPTTKDPNNPVATAPKLAVSPELEKLQRDLADLDKDAPPGERIKAMSKAIETYYTKRIAIVQQIIPLDKADQRETWYKQLFDNMTALAQNSGDAATIGKLNAFKDQVTKSMPNSNLAGYGVYRCMWTDYAVALADNPPQETIVKLQTKWLADLGNFVKDYPKGDDTPEALYQLAVGCEFNGKTAESKRWYQTLMDNFPTNHQSPRAKGALARLNLVGNTMTLNAPLLADNTKTFDLGQVKNKFVIVFYWGSYSEQYKADFATITGILKRAGSNVELVSINLDENAAKGQAAVAKAQAPGTHLFQADNNASGLSSPLATQYGIQMLPTVFLVGRDGRVINNALQVADIETELKKVQ